MSVYTLLLVKVQTWHGWGHCQGIQGPVSPCLMLSPAWVMPHPHPCCPLTGMVLEEKGNGCGLVPPPSCRSSRAGTGLTLETLVPPAPGSSTQAPDSRPWLEPHIQHPRPSKGPRATQGTSPAAAQSPGWA